MKRFLSILISLIIAMSGLTSVYAGDDEFYTQDTIEMYNERTGLFAALGILEKTDIKDLTTEVLRGEFADIMLNFVGVKGADDATYEERYSEYANKFNMSQSQSLNETVEFSEVIKVFVKALGYGLMAESSSYDEVGSSIGLLKGINEYRNYSVTYYLLSEIIENALETEVPQISFENGRYVITSGNNTNKKDYLYSTYNIRKQKGIVTTTNYSDLIKDTALNNNHIAIDNKEYHIYDNFPELLGYNVQYYLNEEDEIIYIHKLKNKNKTVIIQAEDIESYQDRVYEYCEENKSKFYQIPSDCYIIYNYKAVSQITDQIMKPETGYIELIDNDNDGNIDVLNIVTYKIVEIYSVEYYNRIIFDKNDSSGQYNFENAVADDKCVILDEDGQKIEFEMLERGNIVALYNSLDNSVVKIELINDSVNGKITKVSRSDREIGVDGEVYSALEDIFNIADVSMGKYGRFYLYNNKISAFRRMAGEKFTGYLMKAVITDEDADDEYVFVKILDSSNSIKRYHLNDKVKIDNVLAKTPQRAMGLLYIGDTGNVEQVIEYTLNDKGFVDSINTPYNNKVQTDLDGLNRIQPINGESEDSLRIIYPESDIAYRSVQRSLDGHFNISKGTVVFKLPTNSTDNDDYAVVGWDYFDDTKNYKIEAYSTDEGNLVADIAVIKEGEANNKVAYGVIKDIKYELDANNEAICEVKMICKYGENVYKFEDDSMFGDIDIGDFVKCEYTLGNKGKKIELQYDASEPDMTNAIKMSVNPSTDSMFSGINRLMFGYIYEIDGEVAALTPVKPLAGTPVTTLKLENHNIGMYKIYILDTQGRKTTINPGSVSDLRDFAHVGGMCSKVGVILESGQPMIMVIFK